MEGKIPVGIHGEIKENQNIFVCNTGNNVNEIFMKTDIILEQRSPICQTEQHWRQ